MLSFSLLKASSQTIANAEQLFSDPEINGPHLISEGDLDQIRILRACVWRAAGVTNPKMFQSGIKEGLGAEAWSKEQLDSTGYHVLIRDGDKIIAAARISIHLTVDDLPDGDELSEFGSETEIAFPIASLNRLVVHPDYQGKGLGKSLLEPRLRIALRAGCQSVIGNASSKIGNQYQKLGCLPLGQSQAFDDIQEPHTLYIGNVFEAWSNCEFRSLDHLLRTQWIPEQLATDSMFVGSQYHRALVGVVFNITQQDSDWPEKFGSSQIGRIEKISTIVPELLRLYLPYATDEDRFNAKAIEKLASDISDVPNKKV